MAKPFEITDATFETEALQSPDPVLVDFWAEWCGPCKMIAPAVEAIAETYDEKLRVAKMDVDANSNTPRRLGIMGIPTLILFKDGKEVTRIVGYRSEEALSEELSPYLE
jgi:thioredoxin 1